MASMCEYCDIEDWMKENPYPPVPDPLWNVRFLDVETAMGKTKADPQHRYIDVRLKAPNRFVAERVAWDVLQQRIGHVPFKDDFVLMGSSEVHSA